MSRWKAPFLFGMIAIFLGVITVPLSYEFSQTLKPAFHYVAVALSLCGLALVVIALKTRKSSW